MGMRIAKLNRRSKSKKAEQQKIAEGSYDTKRKEGGVLGLGDWGKDQQALSASQLSGDQIRKIQQKLNQEGFRAGQVDGKWSSNTQTAIRDFQTTKGMKATGQLDERTLDALGLDADELQRKG